MKKVILLTGVIVMMYAGSAFATGAATIPSGFVSGFNLSKNVVAIYGSGTPTVPAAGFSFYAIATKHTQGDKTYGGVSTNTGMYGSTGVAAGTAVVPGNLPTIPTASGDGVAGGIGGWTSM